MSLQTKIHYLKGYHEYDNVEGAIELNISVPYTLKELYQTRFQGDSLPLSITLLLDTSGSMKPSEDFVTMKPYNVPSKKYIVINNDYQFIIFDNGKQIDTSNMKLAQDMGNLVIQENGVPKYFVTNLEKLTFLKFYPLYILAL